MSQQIIMTHDVRRIFMPVDQTIKNNLSHATIC